MWTCCLLRLLDERSGSNCCDCEPGLSVGCCRGISTRLRCRVTPGLQHAVAGSMAGSRTAFPCLCSCKCCLKGQGLVLGCGPLLLPGCKLLATSLNTLRNPQPSAGPSRINASHANGVPRVTCVLQEFVAWSWPGRDWVHPKATLPLNCNKVAAILAAQGACASHQTAASPDPPVHMCKPRTLHFYRRSRQAERFPAFVPALGCAGGQPNPIPCQPLQIHTSLDRHSLTSNGHTIHHKTVRSIAAGHTMGWTPVVLLAQRHAPTPHLT